MNIRDNQLAESAAIPHAIIKKKKGVSIIWIVPLVAIFIAFGLIFRTVVNKDLTFTISFKSAEGIEAGKTKIKYKDVIIGEVESLKIGPDLKNVIVTARLKKETGNYLTDGTRFWVVRARLSGGIASGLGTLLSGSYIAIDPSLKGNAKSNFKGLEVPPVVTSDLPGRHFRLKAKRLGSVGYGSPVYFKGIKVGQVVGYQFADQNKDLEINIFINAPYDQNVNDTSRFWFSSGLDIVFNAQGVRVDTQSFVSLMIGGLAFDSPNSIDQLAVGEDHLFELYDSPKDALATQYLQKEYYLLKFDNSVRGLAIGAPVEFRGFPFGKVVDIAIETDWKNNQMKIPVKIEVEPERIEQLMKKKAAPEDALQRLVALGLRAQMATGNIITGSKYVALDIFTNAAPASLIVHNDIIELPTIPTPLDELTDNLTSLMNRFSKIPVDKIGQAALDTIQSIEIASQSFKTAGDGITELITSEEIKDAVTALNQSLEQVRRLTAQLEQQLPESVNSISHETITTLTEIQKLTASDSNIVFDLRRALKEFAEAAQNISQLADLLERHPESLLNGKGRE